MLRMEKQPGGLEVARLSNSYPAKVSALWWPTDLKGCEAIGRPEVVVVPPGGSAVLGRLRTRGSGQERRISYRYRYTFGEAGERPDGQPLALPFGPFRRVRVMQGPNGGFSHRGKAAYDFELPEGAWVLAARAGQVVRLYRGASSGGIGPSFLGELAVNAVLLAHEDGSFGYYAHFKPQGVAVGPGQRVAVGERLGQAGATGYATGPHLHFELNAAGEEATSLSYPVRFRTATQKEGQALTGGEWVEAP